MTRTSMPAVAKTTVDNPRSHLRRAAACLADALSALRLADATCAPESDEAGDIAVAAFHCKAARAELTKNKQRTRRHE